jgi:PRC-barrel domain
MIDFKGHAALQLTPASSSEKFHGIDANEAIGKIDDLLVSTDGKAAYAVLSIGGFLGMVRI